MKPEPEKSRCRCSGVILPDNLSFRFKQKDFFDGDTEDFCDIVSQPQRRVVLVLLKKYDGFPAYIYFTGKIILGHIVSGPQFPYPVIHGAFP